MIYGAHFNPVLPSAEDCQRLQLLTLVTSSSQRWSHRPLSPNSSPVEGDLPVRLLVPRTAGLFTSSLQSGQVCSLFFSLLFSLLLILWSH